MSDLLRRECRVFTRYLIDTEPTDYISARYVAAHDARPEVGSPTRFDRALVGVARLHPWAARLADSYSVLLRPRGTLRQKLVLLLAILESTVPTARLIDAADGAWVTVASGTVRGVLFVCWLVAGLIVFTPVRLVTAVRGE